MTSLVARLAGLAIRLTGRRRNLARDDLDPEAAVAKRPRPARPTRAMRRELRVTWETRDGFEVYTLTPRGPVPGGGAIYLHGGAYTSPITSLHWRFIAWMVDATGLAITVPLYPLTPEHACKEITAFAMAIYRDGLEARGGAPVALMGDSAGGGLALSLAMQVRDAGLPVPGGLVLIAPWLDVTMREPSQARIEPSDVMLMRPGVRALGRWYAGDWAATDERVSPLFGTLRGLPPIELLCGSHDILVADARRLAAQARAEDAALAYHEEPGLMHVYPLLGLPESRRAEARITRFLQSVRSGAGPQAGPAPP
ncbi:alpha/beta hydrolase fold domain-containing protein [Methylobacterium sp. J-068]|uniref:alpha/beta hydrolase fold domain-containing protein n=1 Tax=Methylobacterium sp. J-068 TaxID=2836649 RepID=UPI001FBA9C60|nr:alpha/beta hydrolase [Methylobacterium sp. J-068]MCJ2036176.1 alpha/beta hydrolase [Methylobacterium sp. J-068]